MRNRKYKDDEEIPKEELAFVLEEKRAFLDLILAFVFLTKQRKSLRKNRFATSVKHRLRGEHGIYFDE